MNKSGSQFLRGGASDKHLVYEELWNNEFLLGNINAPIRLIYVTSLHCKACSIEYKALKKLLEEYPAFIHIAVRFRIKDDEQSQSNELIVKHIINTYFNTDYYKKKEQILSDWFAVLSFAEFKKRCGDSAIFNQQYSDISEQHKEWVKKQSIQYSPALFINGTEVVRPITIKELRLLIIKLIEDTFH